MSEGVRQPHAALDSMGRAPKAEKIYRLLGVDGLPRPLRVLEVGCGSGIIAAYFAWQLGARGGQVSAVDVMDQRVTREGYQFQRVDGTDLPFEDASFDVVISNHVIEHVGDESDQLAHLRELKRVLGPSGLGYLAVPSRWQIVEPHFQLAFLSWLPRQARTPYLRWRGKGDFYDCEPLTCAALESYFRASGLQFRSLFVPALRAFASDEQADSAIAKVVARLPNSLLGKMGRFSPTHVYLFGRI